MLTNFESIMTHKPGCQIRKFTYNTRIDSKHDITLFLIEPTPEFISLTTPF